MYSFNLITFAKFKEGFLCDTLKKLIFLSLFGNIYIYIFENVLLNFGREISSILACTPLAVSAPSP